MQSIHHSERSLAGLREAYRQLQSVADSGLPLPAFEVWLAEIDLAKTGDNASTSDTSGSAGGSCDI